MHFPRITWIPFTLAGAGILALCWKVSSPGNPQPTHQASASPAQFRTTGASLTNPVRDAFDRMRDTSDGRGTLETLRHLQEKLRSMPPREAVAWVHDFLNAGTDRLTGLTFQISNGHTLSEWPSFRTFLIDTLLAIDPEAAATASRAILDTPTSADEWALALRNVGRVETSAEANEYLRAKTETLIANPSWQANPSIGYLNAFDVLVHTNATGSTALLSELIQRKDRKDLVHASFLTLDRLVQQNPAEVLTRLAGDLPLAQSRPEMVAQQFARADIRDPAQREIVKNWLLDPARTATELRSFAGVYPNNNSFISNNLLTDETPKSGTDLGAHDREALEIIGSWENDPAFAPVKPHLITMQNRLTTFVSQAAE